MPDPIEVKLTPELKAEFDKMNNAVHELRQKNDEFEKQRQKDALTAEQLQRINESIDKNEKSMEDIKTAIARKDKGVEAGQAGAEQVSEYRAAFKSYLRKGDSSGLEFFIANLTPEQAKAMSVGSDEDGGYTVTPAMSDTMSKVIQESSAMREVASVETISTDSLDILVDKDLSGGSWTGETDAPSDTDTPGFGKVNIPTHEMYAQPKATQKLIDDSSIDVEAWLGEKVGEKFAALEGAAFITGDGVAKPRGILTYTDGTAYGQIEQIVNGHATTLSADSILKLFYGVKEDYAKNGVFLMNRSTIQTVRLLKESTTNAYIWQPGLQAGQPNLLAGAPVKQMVDMPAIASAALPIAFGDFRRGYQIVDRVGARVLRDPFTDKPYIKFYTTKRVGGAAKNFEAFKLLVMST